MSSISVMRFDDRDLREMVARIVVVLQRGGVVAVPTDTVYGLVCDARNEAAILRIYAMKGRSGEKALPVFVRDAEMAREHAEISEKAGRVLERVWPGMTTVILKQKNQKTEKRFPALSVGGRDTVALRVSGHGFLRAVFSRINFPLAQTSANVSGRPSATCAKEVRAYFKDASEQPDLIVDGGWCGAMPSTLLDLTTAVPKILREGAVPAETLSPVLDACGFGRIET